MVLLWEIEKKYRDETKSNFTWLFVGRLKSFGVNFCFKKLKEFKK
jgi:hypothetical protein